MIAAGAAGTTADMVYGYLIECSQYTTTDLTKNGTENE